MALAECRRLERIVGALCSRTRMESPTVEYKNLCSLLHLSFISWRSPSPAEPPGECHSGACECFRKANEDVADQGFGANYLRQNVWGKMPIASADSMGRHSTVRLSSRFADQNDLTRQSCRNDRRGDPAKRIGKS